MYNIYYVYIYYVLYILCIYILCVYIYIMYIYIMYIYIMYIYILCIIYIMYIYILIYYVYIYINILCIYILCVYIYYVYIYILCIYIYINILCVYIYIMYIYILIYYVYIYIMCIYIYYVCIYIYYVYMYIMCIYILYLLTTSARKYSSNIQAIFKQYSSNMSLSNMTMPVYAHVRSEKSIENLSQLPTHPASLRGFLQIHQVSRAHAFFLAETCGQQVSPCCAHWTMKSALNTWYLRHLISTTQNFRRASTKVHSLSLSWTWILKTLKAYQRKDRKLGVSASNLKVSDSHKGSRCLNLSTKGEKTTPKSEKLWVHMLLFQLAWWPSKSKHAKTILQGNLLAVLKADCTRRNSGNFCSKARLHSSWELS